MKKGRAAELLDRLGLWVLEQAAEYPIRSNEFDEAILRAEASCQLEALRVYRSSRSLDVALEAAQKSFTLDLLTSHLAPAFTMRGERPQLSPGLPSVAAGIHSVG